MYHKIMCYFLEQFVKTFYLVKRMRQRKILEKQFV